MMERSGKTAWRAEMSWLVDIVKGGLFLCHLVIFFYDISVAVAGCGGCGLVPMCYRWLGTPSSVLGTEVVFLCPRAGGPKCSRLHILLCLLLDPGVVVRSSDRVPQSHYTDVVGTHGIHHEGSN
jgi:hypothetical protein